MVLLQNLVLSKFNSLIGQVEEKVCSLAGFVALASLHAEGMVEQYRACVKPWGFIFEQIHCLVTMWQVDADKVVPKHWAEEMAKRISQARMILIKGEGHLLPNNYYGLILSELAQECLNPNDSNS